MVMKMMMIMIPLHRKSNNNNNNNNYNNHNNGKGNDKLARAPIGYFKFTRHLTMNCFAPKSLSGQHSKICDVRG